MATRKGKREGKQRKPQKDKNNGKNNHVAVRTLKAGCQRTRVLETELTEIAYRALEYPECPTCPHRVEPEKAAPFCVWRDENTPHPFAGLAALKVVDEAE